MTKKHVVAFWCNVVIGTIGTISIWRFISTYIPRLENFESLSGSLYFFFCLWLYEDVRKQLHIREDERAAVLKHERRKKSVVLSRHPLYESASDINGIKSMDQLDFFFDRNWEDVDELDYDKDGHYIFRNHRYYHR